MGSRVGAARGRSSTRAKCLRVQVGVLLGVLVPFSAAAEDAIRVEFFPKGQQGGQPPGIVVHTNVMVDDIALEVVRKTDGRRLGDSTGRMLAGRTRRFDLPIDRVGTAHFSGFLALKNGKEVGQMPIEIECELLAALNVSVPPESVDLALKKLRVVAPRPVRRIEVSLMSDVGTPLGTTEIKLPAPASEAEVSYTQENAGNVMRMNVQVFDDYGFFGGVELFPWRVDIPHEEVHFASGSYEITKDESPKLEKSYVLVNDAIQKYGKLAAIKLFIAGHTDTVGDRAMNKTLSRDRARTIGAWFKKRGVRVPILFVGFGEDRLYVDTPDETDEARNRRAEYIVAIEPPAVGATFSPL
ncbi:MAG: OmpA family protein [Deltaproteobacteria bacterium]|nr:OmpA family protein [Deltaproteobacteria bacterium]